MHVLSSSATTGWLTIGNRRFLCRTGSSGVVHRKREGDGATPAGCWSAIGAYYRPDRVARPRTRLPVKRIKREGGWCDDPLDRNYNRPVRLPYPAGTESLWRRDHAYDLFVVLDYNYSKRSLFHGSAIFMHLMHDDHRPTAGCLAFSQSDLRQLLGLLGSGSLVCM